MTSSTAGRVGQRAVVIGGGVAGLLTARVLSAYFDRVTIFDRDKLRDDTEPRKAIPQGKHLHHVLEGGTRVIEELFPGISEEMIANGSTAYDTCRDVGWFRYGSWQKRIPTGVLFRSQSRPFLENHIRRRVRAIANVEILEEYSVESLIHAADRRRVTGVRVSSSREPQSDIQADLVVDAAGRGSRAPRWLEEMGYGRPLEEHVKIDLCYASCVVPPPDRGGDDWSALIIYGEVPNKRSGSIVRVENDQWLVSLVGYHGDHPPDDHEGFLAYAKSLERPACFDAIKNSSLGPISRHKIPSAQRRLYERMATFPDAYLVIGDSVCSFDPIFAQGMTMAAFSARLLSKLLAERKSGGIRGLSKKFQKASTRHLNGAWMMSTSEIMRHEETVGRRPSGIGLLNRYKAALFGAGSVDDEVSRQLASVFHLNEGIGGLFRPTIVAKALTLGLSPPPSSRAEKLPPRSR